MEKLSQSQASKKYLENKFGVKAEPLSKKMQASFEEASTNGVYKSSNNRSHLYQLLTVIVFWLLILV